MFAGKSFLMGVWIVVCLLNVINHGIAQEVTTESISTLDYTTDETSVNGRRCSSDEIRCPTSKACFQQYQFCDSYDDCGTGYDEFECPRGPPICQQVTETSSFFKTSCTRSLNTVSAQSVNSSTDGTLYYNVPSSRYVVIDTILITTMDFFVEEFGFLEVVITQYSATTTIDPTVLVISNAINWAAPPENINEVPLRSPIHVDPEMEIETIQLTVSYVADSIPSSSNPYRPPTSLSAESISLTFRQYHDQCASILNKDISSPNLNSCLTSARSYAIASNEAAQMGVSCEPREHVEIVYTAYEECYEQPLPVQPWQSTISTSMTPTTMSMSTVNSTFAPSCEEGELVCPVSFGCYDSGHVCDSWDDCGTGFDESNCSLSDQDGLVCFQVTLNASLFNSRCSTGLPQTFNLYLASEGGPYVLDSFQFPSSSVVYIDFITVSVTSELPGTLYSMFTISTKDKQGAVRNTTALTGAIRVTPGLLILHQLQLRAPLPWVPKLESIEVSVLRTSQADSPSPSNPYENIPLNGISLTTIQYYDRCSSGVNDDSGQTANMGCLRTVLDTRNATKSASSMGLSCLPTERTDFISNLYDHCFEAASIVEINGNMTVFPGQEMELLCAAIGTPLPRVRWVIPDNVTGEVQSYQDSSRSIALLIFTTSAVSMSQRFECVADNDFGETRAITSVFTLGAECVEKTETRDRFQASSHPNQSCPAIQDIRQNTAYFSGNGQISIIYQLPSSGLLYSIDLPSYAFFIPYGSTITALQISLTVTPNGPVSKRRRRREVVPILHEHIAYNVAQNRSNGLYKIYFPAPIQVPANRDLDIALRSLDSSQQIYFIEGSVNLKYLECPRLMDQISDESCYTVYRQWQGLEEELVELGCTKSSSSLFKLYQNCLGITDEPLRELPMTAPDVMLNDDITLHCPITGSIQSYWMKKTSREDILPFGIPSPLLRFQFFNLADQGFYYCHGSGSENHTLDTNLVLLTLKDITTIGFSIAFDIPFFDFYALNSEESGQEFVYPILDALTADLDLAEYLVSSSNQPVIVNVRNGSTIIDYQASFTHNNRTEDLVTGVTKALLNNLQNATELPGDIIFDSITVGSASSCPESVYTGSMGTLTFPSVRLDQIAESVEHCAVYTRNSPVPRATRTCTGDFVLPAYWMDPIMSECFTDSMFSEEETDLILGEIANAPVTSENVTEYSSDLVMVTNQTSSITAEGLESIATSLENIVDVQDPSTEVTINVINAVNNVLEVDDEDFVIAIDAEAPTRILDSLEEQVTLFQAQGDGLNLTVVDQNLAVVAINIPKPALLNGLGFATLGGITNDENVYDSVLSDDSTMVFFDVDEIQNTDFEAAIIIPSGILDAISYNESEDGMVPVSFFIFQNSRLFQSGNQQNTLEPGRRQAVGSRIISATIEGFNVQNLPAGMEIETDFLELNVTEDHETVDARSCVFWDKTASGGEWSTEGCRREDQPGLQRIRCLCDHLTSFAVLLDVSGDIDVYALDILSMIGCGVSALCLVILLLTFLSVKKLRNRQPQQIHINLCLALLGLYIVFMFGINRRYPTGGCVAAGAILHFFLLSSMSWMMVEAVYMYLLFVKIHSGSVSKFLRTSMVFAWGSPLILCIVLVSVNQEFYLGDDSYCFVQPGPVLYYSVLLPIGIILLVNTIIFTLVVYRLTCGRWAIASNKSTDNSKKRKEAWRLLQDLVAFTVLLGLTWVFGFLAIGGARFLFNVLFLIFNSLQGLFVFLMFGLRQKPVRDEWLRCLCCRCGEDDRSQRSNQYKQAKPKKSQASSSSAQTNSTSAGSDIPLDSR